MGVYFRMNKHPFPGSSELVPLAEVKTPGGWRGGGGLS